MTLRSHRSLRLSVLSSLCNRRAGAVLVLVLAMLVPAARATTATTTTLVISSATVSYKTPVILTATVTAGNAPVSAGFVLFCDATAPFCENNSALGRVQLTATNATAVVKIGSGPLGIHYYKAVYRANNTYATSVSKTVSYTVQGTYSTTTTILSSGNVGSYTLAGTVTGIGSLLTGPGGDISFVDTSAGNKILGTEALDKAVLDETFTQAPNSPFSIGVKPNTDTIQNRSLAIASDYIDGDNNLDVVTANTDQTVTVLIGNGDGSFKPKVNYSGCATGQAQKILLADFNRDGNTDIALGCSDNSSKGGLVILLGNGGGKFQDPVSYPTGDVAGLAMGDFNGDGILDIVVSDNSEQDITIFIGNGDGSFKAGVVTVNTPSAANDVVVADFNGDGNDDLAYAVATAASNSKLSDLYVALGNGDGTFKTPVLVASKIGEFLTVGDTNGDNKPDVVSTTVQHNTGANIGKSLFVLIGNGDGTFKPTVTYVSDIPSDPHLADVNGDGKPDIIAGGSSGALVYLGNGDGTFQAYSEPVIGGFSLTYAVNAGDYNNDGNADLIGTDAQNPRAAVSLSEVQQVADAEALTGLALFPLGSGTHYVDASYPTNSIYLGSISSTIPLLAAPTPTTLSLTLSPTSATLAGQPINLTATLDPYTVGPPTTTTDGESVTFFNGATSLGSGTLHGGVATVTTTALLAGHDTVQASYPGDSNYNPSSSSTVSVTVASILLTSAPNPSTYGQTVAFVAKVPSGELGSVTFKDGGTTLGTMPLSGSAASFTTSTLTAGSHDITAIYGGDSSHGAATSPIVTQVVNMATPSLAVTTSGASTYGDSVTIIATLSPSGPTGPVTFTSGSTLLGTGTVNGSGIATITTSTLPAGSDPITATYKGDGNYNGAVGSTTQMVGKRAPVLPAPSVSSTNTTVGSPETISETVPPGVTGPVTFNDGSTPIGTAPIVNGVATITVSTLPGGTDPITASTPGDANNNPATSPATVVTVTKATPTIALTSSINPSSAGQSVTFTATAPTGATGSVVFLDGATTLGTVALTSGQASITTNALTAGSHTITADYGGDSSYNATNSTPLVQTVNKGSPALPPPAVSASTLPSGSSETISETVPAGVTGPVTFYDGSTVIGTAPIVKGVASITVILTTIGTDSITASTPSDANNNAATSPITLVVVSKAIPTVALTSSVNPAEFNQAVTFTATVPATASGMITFVDGAVVLGTGAVNAAGFAILTTSNLTIGSHTITASYGGNSSYDVATSAPLGQVIGKIPTAVTLSQSAATQLLHNTVTFAATVTAASPTPTGTVTFLEGTTVLGTIALNTNGTVVALAKSADAAYATSGLTTGTHQIVAVYSGDTSFSASTSAPVTYIVQDFTNTVNGVASQNVFPGDTTSYKFDLAPLGATTFLSDLNLTVAGLPPGTTYTFTPATIAAGSGTTSVVLNVVTSGSLSAQNRLPKDDPTSQRGLPIALGMLGLFGLGVVRKHGRRMPRMWMLLLLLLGSLLPVAGLSGCAGGYFTLTPTTYSVSVTGTEGSIQHTATATLVVQ